MDFNNRTKNFVRSNNFALFHEPVRNAIILPSKDCREIIELGRLGNIDEESSFICFEKDASTRRIMEDNLNQLSVPYEVYHNLEAQNLSQILQGRKSNFMNLDLCGMMTPALFNWLYFNVKVQGSENFTENAFLSFNIKVTPRGSAPFYFFQNEQSPDRNPLIKTRRKLSVKEISHCFNIFCSIADMIPGKTFYSDEVIYQSDDAITTMITSTFLLDK
jgi:hypothetical protein